MASFQVSDTTLKLLKNFSGVQKSLLLVEGKDQKTIASGKSVLALASFPEAWPKETGIYDLNMFLGTLSLFKKPEIQFGEDAMVISDGPSRVKYRYSDPTTILTPPNKSLKTDNPGAEFTLTDVTLAQLSKTTSVLSLDAVTFTVQDGEIVVRASDVKNPASHAFEFTVPGADAEIQDGFSKTLTFKTEHLGMLLDGTYRVSLGAWSYGYFVHQSEPVSYFIVAQA